MNMEDLMNENIRRQAEGQVEGSQMVRGKQSNKHRSMKRKALTIYLSLKS